jgi:hypothetical protein
MEDTFVSLFRSLRTKKTTNNSYRLIIGLDNPSGESLIGGFLTLRGYDFASLGVRFARF